MPPVSSALRNSVRTPARALHGWPVHAAGYFDRAAFVERLQRRELALRGSARPTLGERGRRLPRWHSAAITLLRVPPRITPGLTVMPRSRRVKPAILSNLARHFDDGAGAVCEIEPGVRGAAMHGHRVIADAFARGFQLCRRGPARVRAPARPRLRARLASVSARDDGLPTSSSEFTCRMTLRDTGKSSSRSARIAEMKKRQPGLHVEHARPP